MSATAVSESVTNPAVPEQVRAARAFVAGVPGESHVHAEAALLLASELVTNSVLYSGSAVPGAVVKVTVEACAEAVRGRSRTAGATSAPATWTDLGWTRRVPRMDP